MFHVKASTCKFRKSSMGIQDPHLTYDMEVVRPPRLSPELDSAFHDICAINAVDWKHHAGTGPHSHNGMGLAQSSSLVNQAEKTRIHSGSVAKKAPPARNTQHYRKGTHSMHRRKGTRACGDNCTPARTVTSERFNSRSTLHGNSAPQFAASPEPQALCILPLWPMLTDFTRFVIDAPSGCLICASYKLQSKTSIPPTPKKPNSVPLLHNNVHELISPK